MKTRIGLLLFVLAFLISCQQNKSAEAPAIKKGMIKVTILYPNGDGKTFDMDYYVNKHMPLVKSRCGDSLKVIVIDKGLAAGAPDTPVPYLAIGYLYFDKISAYKNSIGPYIDEIRADIPKYTNITPVIQISEVMQ
jgi:uncharacterized protein (TIGR02118 family)